MTASLTSWGTVNITEVLWTVIGLVGLHFSSRNLKDIQRDAVAIMKRNGQSIEHFKIATLIIHGHARNEILRLLKSTLIFAAGVAAMITPPVNPQRPVSPLSLIITVMLFGVSAMVVLGSILDARQRRVLRALGNESVS